MPQKMVEKQRSEMHVYIYIYIHIMLQNIFI